MALQNSFDHSGTAGRRRRSRLALESLEQRVPLAADVVTAIAPVPSACQLVPSGPDGMVVTPMPVVVVGESGPSVPGFPGACIGSGGAPGEPGLAICVLPGPELPSGENPVVTGGPDEGGENVILMTTAVQRTNTAGMRPAALVSPRPGARPRITPALQQTSRPRRTNEVQPASLPVTRQPQQTGHFSRQIAARFARLSAAALR